MVSLALENVTAVHSLDQFFVRDLKLVLRHESMRELRLLDDNGQAVTLLWFFTHYIRSSTE